MTDLDNNFAAVVVVVGSRLGCSRSLSRGRIRVSAHARQLGAGVGVGQGAVWHSAAGRIWLSLVEGLAVEIKLFRFETFVVAAAAFVVLGVAVVVSVVFAAVVVTVVSSLVGQRCYGGLWWTPHTTVHFDVVADAVVAAGVVVVVVVARAPCEVQLNISDFEEPTLLHCYLDCTDNLCRPNCSCRRLEIPEPDEARSRRSDTFQRLAISSS